MLTVDKLCLPFVIVASAGTKILVGGRVVVVVVGAAVVVDSPNYGC